MAVKAILHDRSELFVKSIFFSSMEQVVFVHRFPKGRVRFAKLGEFLSIHEGAALVGKGVRLLKGIV